MKNPPLYILATCRRTDLLPAATLVFDTLRVGFPDNPVHVWINTPHASAAKAITQAATKAGCETRPIETIHHKWIELLVGDSEEPFWLCDTDIIFWRKWEWDLKGCYLAGDLIPRFRDRFTHCETEARLHTSLLYIDPELLRRKTREWRQGIHWTAFNPPVNLYYPLVLPPNRFHDTCSLLYHAVGGTPFSPEQRSSYEHLHCGTWVDLIDPTYPGMRMLHNTIYQSPALARGLHEVQAKFYAAHAL